MTVPLKTQTALSAVDEHISRSPFTFADAAVKCFVVYYLTSLVVIFAVLFGLEFVKLCADHHDSRGLVPETIAGRFAPWDGVWYRRIAMEGYRYDPEKMSNVAFFPLYPITARNIAATTGIHVDYALLLTSHIFLIGAFLLFACYVGHESRGLSANQQACAVAMLGLYPTTFYWRMSYTESAFLFITLLAMYGMIRRWPVIPVAIVVGLATAVRPTGVALLLPFAAHIWRNSSSVSAFLARSVLLIPLACWGLLSYMSFQWMHFGDPFAFVKTQIHWYERVPPQSVFGKVSAYATLMPFRQVYDSSCECYWALDAPRGTPIFSMQFMNPIFVGFAWIVVAIGAWKRILKHEEILLALGLFAIPYVLHSYRACMASEARYASVVFPVYVVLGYATAKLPLLCSACVWSMCAFFLAVYTSLFVMWYWFY